MFLGKSLAFTTDAGFSLDAGEPARRAVNTLPAVAALALDAKLCAGCAC